VDGLGVAGSIVVHDEALLAKIHAGTCHLSPGYKADFVEDSGEYRGVEYSWRHANYSVAGVERLEHLAVVPTGRHGDAASIHINDNALNQAIALAWEEYKAPIVLNATALDAATTDQTTPTDAMDPTLESTASEATEDPIEELTETQAEEVAEGLEEIAIIAATAPANQATLDMVLEAIANLQNLINQGCPACAAAAAANEAATAEAEAPIKSALTMDAMPEIIELDRQARSVGLNPTPQQLSSNRRGVRTAIAAKLGVMVNDSMSDDVLAGVVTGAIAMKPAAVGIKAAVSVHKEVQTAKVERAAIVDHPMAGLI
jgi:hypothetical protein